MTEFVALETLSDVTSLLQTAECRRNGLEEKVLHRNGIASLEVAVTALRARGYEIEVLRVRFRISMRRKAKHKSQTESKYMSQLRSQSASQSEKSSAPCPNFLQQCRAMKSNQSFPTTVRHLLEMRDMKVSELGRRAIRLGWQQSPKHLYRVVRGEVTVTPAHMELLARALDVQPEVFAEFRLWQVRRLFDPEQVGFKAAIEALKSWEGAGGVVAAPAEPHDAAELAADADLDADEAHAGQP